MYEIRDTKLTIVHSFFANNINFNLHTFGQGRAFHRGSGRSCQPVWLKMKLPNEILHLIDVAATRVSFSKQSEWLGIF